MKHWSGYRLCKPYIDSEGDALIAASDSDLAILQGIEADSLTESDFAFG